MIWAMFGGAFILLVGIFVGASLMLMINSAQNQEED